MNIIFITDNYVNPTSGGIVRTTYVLANALVKEYQHTCYSVYVNSDPLPFVEEGPFTWIAQWRGEDDFRSKIAALGSCIIIIQAPCVLARLIIPMNLPSAKQIYVFHGTPGFEIVPLQREVALYRLTHGIEIKQTLKQLILQAIQSLTSKKFMHRLLEPKYALPLGKVNHIVVLSSGIINQYLSIASGDAHQFSVIPNAFVFPTNQDITQKKKKEVLIVARLDDWHKRILDALKIWQQVQLDPSVQDWTLRIVGDGIDRSFYQSYVKKKNIPNISFEGHLSPLPYYQNASIFMMTSACEGMPMTLLEAKQCGCVLIAYNNFASTHDLIQHGIDGFLVDKDDITDFVSKLKLLMTDETLRQIMNQANTHPNTSFNISTVAEQWNQLINQIC